MKIIKKAALSLVLTAILFSVFTLISYSYLFDLIETNFYNKKVINDTQIRTEKISEGVQSYEKDRIELFRQIAEESSVRNTFLVNQSREDIFRRQNLLDLLVEKDIQFSFLRIIDQEGKIHFSNNPDDILSSDQQRITYKMADETGGRNFRELVDEFGDSALVFNAENNLNSFIVPVSDNFGIKRGHLFAYLNREDVKRYLALNGYIDRSTPVGFAGYKGIIINIFDGNPEIIQKIINYWDENEIINPYQIYTDDQNNSFSLITQKNGKYFTGYYISDSLFRINSIYRSILLVTVFSAIYLALFLLMNLKQDNITIIADRVKRFQINFLIEYIDQKNDIEWKKWKKELEERREEIRKEFKKGIRGIKGEKEKVVNELIDKSWEEIISLLAGHLEKKGEKTSVSSLHIENIEEIIKKIISSQKEIALKTEKPSVTPTPVRVKSAAPVDVGVEELEEAEAVEELEEAEAVEELEEAEEAEAVEELEEAEEAEAVEELEEAEAAEAVEELEETEEAEAVEELEEAEAEAVEELEEAEAAEELEEAEEAEAGEELEEVEAVGDAETEEGEDAVAELEAAEAVEELKEAGDLVEKLPRSERDETDRFRELLETYRDYGEEIISADEVQRTIAEIENNLIPVNDGEDESDLSKLEKFRKNIGAAEKNDYSEEEVIPELEELEEIEVSDVESDSEEYSEMEEVISETDKEEPLEELEQVEAIKPLEVDVQEEDLEMLEEAEKEEQEGIFVVDYIKNNMIESYQRQNYMPDFFYEKARKQSFEQMSGLAEAALLEEINGYYLENLDSLSFLDKVDALKKERLLEVVSVSSIIPDAVSSDAAVVENDGILEINRTLYREEGKNQDKDLKDLVNKVVDNEAKEKVNVSDFFFNQTIDLPVFSDIRNVDYRETCELHFDGSYGMDYDSYLANEKGDKTVAAMKLLLKLSREIGSFFGALIVQDEAAYYPEAVVGLDNKSEELFYIKKKEPLYRELLSDNSILFIKTRLDKIEEIKSKFSERDAEKIESLIFFPIKYRQKHAYFVASPDLNIFSYASFILKVKNLQK